MDANTLALALAVTAVFLAIFVREVRVLLHRAYRRGYDAAGRTARALDDLLDQSDEQPRRDVEIRRGSDTPIRLVVRGLSKGEHDFLQRTRGGVSTAGIVATALVDPKLNEAEVRETFYPSELLHIMDAVMELSGFTR